MSQIPGGMELAPSERVFWYGRRSFKSYITLGGIFWLLLLIVPSLFFPIFVIITAPLLLLTFLIWGLGVLCTEYAITNRRVYSKFGLIRRKVYDAKFNKITDASISQGFFGRIFDYGQVSLNTAGNVGFEINFRGVSDPKGIRGKIAQMSEGMKKEKRIDERIERLEDRYLTGEITKEQFETAKRRLKERE